ncbi:hypothetical protein [Clostridium drakei]|uniref:Uncharacterized protein n=1 Tax=Clostridium drakei TaxID=332101 RepID=A0A2U8DST3_9CLOT|nr:hypothetical protein [Clostridium drakei]AWI05817.1 hypothetical protein B9W14_15350 [Clostridium drakei]
MSTVNSTSNSYNLYTQNSTQISNSQGQTKVHHHHKKAESQNSPQFSKEGLQALSEANQDATGTTPKSPLDSLVASGTITQDQENSIKSAFRSAKQASLSGAYSSTPANPISSLVANGTITQDQADAIKNSLQSIVQAKQGTQQVSGSQGNTRIHHHHHHVQQMQGTEESSQTTPQSADSSK